MLTDRLRIFLGTWCNVEADPQDVVDSLAVRPATDFAIWLQDDLRRAILGGDLTPDLAERLTDIGFTDQAEVDAWLQECWAMWFPEVPYPK